MSDLWPSDIFEAEEITTPFEILKLQATFLGEKTKNVLKGIVNQDLPKYTKYPFQYTFYINAPTEGDYSFKLFSIHHDINLYPVLITPDEEITKEILGEKYKALINIRYKDEETFKSGLKQIFNSAKTKRVIGSLLQMTKGKLSAPLNTDIPF